jgi:hypothetical protein
MEDSKIRIAVEKAKACKHDFTQLVADALKNCQPYRKLDWSCLRAGDDIAQYSIDEDKRDLLEDNDVDTFDKYCTNKDDVEKAQELAHNLVTEHLVKCDVQSCIDLNNARADLEVDGYETR